MKLPSAKLVPLFITAAAILLAVLLHLSGELLPGFKMIERLEWMTYDWRMRLAPHPLEAASDQLGFVDIGDDAIALFSEGHLGPELQFGLKWPRQVYGRVIRELKAQGAKAVALDVLFGERRPDHPQVATTNGPIDSDRFFQHQLQAAGNVIIGATREVVPHPWFRSSAWNMGDISIDRDSDGVLRRVKAFHDYRIWHPRIQLEAKLNNWDLAQARIGSNHVSFPLPSGREAVLALTQEGYFDPSELDGSPKPAGGIIRLQKAFEDRRVWHLGIALAAYELGLDLSRAEVDLRHRQIILRGNNGEKRILPVDRQGRMLIDWSLHQDNPALTKDAFETLVAQDLLRQYGTNSTRFRGKLVVIGSSASGNELADRGATPLEKDTFLTSNHWNVANTMLTGRFIRQSSALTGLLLIGGLGLMTAWLTLRLRVVWAAAAAAILCLGYISISLFGFFQVRYWLPLVTPVGVVLLVHFSLISYQAFFEQTEKRRIKQIFSKIVSPEVVQELLNTWGLSLVGARRPITVLFTDVRGFTEMTDRMQAQTEAYVRERQLSPAEAKNYSDARAQEVLETVNRYLGLVADIIKKHAGTLDKYIGDCVMAFWGAPTPNEQHALACVRAAIESQQAIAALNREREAENQRREQENLARAARGEAPQPMLHILSLGAGINTGVVTVGLMGSDAHIVNYTVFGREVNLAARLESISNRSTILIGEATYQELLRDAPELAAACLTREPTRLKGFSTAVQMYEVPWHVTPAELPEPIKEPAAALATAA